MLLLNVGMVEGFSLSADSAEIEVCAGSTIVAKTLAQGTGSFTVSTEGDGKAFAMTVPAEFSLDDGTQNIYSYISPTSRTEIGTYSLVVKVKSGDETKEQEYDIKVKDCHEADLSVSGDKLICPCEKAVFSLDLENNGAYRETFELSVEGTAAKWTNLSTDEITIESGEEKSFTATVEAPCNVYGKYTLTFKASAQKSTAEASAKADLDIQPCYDYELVMGEEYSLCEKGELEISLEIENLGTANNTFKINLEAPEWVSIEKETEIIGKGESKTVKININPPIGTQGNFTIKIGVLTEIGDVKKEAKTDIFVEKCYGISVDTAKKGIICDQTKKYSYPVVIKNSGKFEEELELSMDGPEWAVLEKEKVNLEKDEEKEINLEIDPKGAEAKSYTVEIKATSSEGAESTDSIIIEISKEDECYSPALKAEKQSLEVALEKAMILSIELENKGLEKATFIIDLEEDGKSFSMINPTIVEKLEPGKTETLYLHVSPPLFTETGDYDLTISARVENKEITASEKIKIKVIEEEAEDEETEEENKENFIIVFFKKIWDFFKDPLKDFSVAEENESGEAGGEAKISEETGDDEEADASEEIEDVKESSEEEISEEIEGDEEELSDEEISEELSDEEITELEEESDEEIEEEVSEEAEEEENGEIEEDEKTSGIFSFSEWLSKIFGIKDLSESMAESEMQEEVEEASDEEIEANGEIEEDEETEEELDEEEASDGEIEEDEEEEVNEDETESEEDSDNEIEDTEDNTTINFESEDLEESEEDETKKLDFFQYKNYILGAILIVIVIIIFSTGSWKKIVDFFEEEE